MVLGSFSPKVFPVYKTSMAIQKYTHDLEIMSFIGVPTGPALDFVLGPNCN